MSTPGAASVQADEGSQLRAKRRSSSIVPVNLNGVSPVGQYRHVPEGASLSLATGTRGLGQDPMAALAAVIATEALATRIDTDSGAASSQHQQRDSAVALVSSTSELTQSDEELVRTVAPLHHFVSQTWLPGELVGNIVAQQGFPLIKYASD